MQPIFKQFSRSTSDFVLNKCDSEHSAGRMSAVEYNRAVRINSLIDSYAARYEGKTVEIFRCLERKKEYIEIQDLIIKQTQAWKILGPMHLTNPYDCTISVHRFMSGGAVNGARLGVIKRYCDQEQDIEHNFIADEQFDERLELTNAEFKGMCDKAGTAKIAQSGTSAAQTVQAGIDRSLLGAGSSVAVEKPTETAGPQNITINAGNIILPPNLSPIASSPIPYNPPKKRKIEILEQLAEGMQTMTANFSRLLEEVKEENRGRDASFEVVPEQ